MKQLPGTVVVLGIVSLLTDMSSEMIYPLLPVFLSSVLHATPLALGLIEGVAEATAAILKAVSGTWTDRVRRRKPFLLAGYGLAGLVRPLIGLAVSWPMVLGLRFMDRAGKGIRTSPRDALIADVVASDQRGHAYGFHRAMDHAGAVAGPLIAAGLVWLGLSLRSVFLLAAVPAVLVVVCLMFGIHERNAPNGMGVHQAGRADWRSLGHRYWRFLGVVFVFTLGNSTDAFFLWRLSEVGVSMPMVAVIWSAHHVVKLLACYVGGRLSDRVGRVRMIMAGWLLYAAVYATFAGVCGIGAMVTLFLVYGLYYGCTEPVEKALVADLVPAHLRGTAFGLFHGVVGLGALPASVLFGWLWKSYGAPVAFMTGAGLALCAALGMSVLLRGDPVTGNVRPPAAHQ